MGKGRRLGGGGGCWAIDRDEDVPTRKRLRHGRWRLFHLYQALRIEVTGLDDIVPRGRRCSLGREWNNAKVEASPSLRTGTILTRYQMMQSRSNWVANLHS